MRHLPGSCIELSLIQGETDVAKVVPATAWLREAYELKGLIAASEAQVKNCEWIAFCFLVQQAGGAQYLLEEVGTSLFEDLNTATLIIGPREFDMSYTSRRGGYRSLSYQYPRFIHVEASGMRALSFQCPRPYASLLHRTARPIAESRSRAATNPPTKDRAMSLP